MNRYRVNALWLDYVVNGVPAKGRYSSSAYWFRDNVMYQHDRGIGRLEYDKVNGWMLIRLTWAAAAPYTTYTDRRGAIEVPFITMPTLGIHSEMEGHMVPSGKKFHDFMLDYFHRASKDLVEKINALTVHSYAADNTWKIIQLRRNGDNITEYYCAYAKHFRMKWPAIPHFSELLDAKVVQLGEKYNNPLAFNRRQRAKARKIAIKLLETKAA
jgi:hypothetical protein